ncbi:P-loop NTPase fold protein [uncultured Holdemanella sp.]|mgnify:CR=1 FL=1|uniref:KAP family P-loop NTPase fold protein n=1 Tax=uncultured Holdemanella sp. TaxID=1763549 RepID=UPI0025D8C19C|nr:P-loop NTPase fold protein [uncultured Holdemanella sp.]
MKKSVLLPTDENLLLTIKEDILDRNAELNSFCHLLSTQNSMNSIALDGRWGSGKTFFVKQCALLINANNSLSNIDRNLAQSILEITKKLNSFDELHDNQLLAVYFDAWENDSEEDPILSLIYRLAQQLDLKTNKFDKECIADLILAIADAIMDRPISNVLKCAKGKDFLDVIYKSQGLNTTITKFFEEGLFKNAEKIVIFIDELDRCRPSYAVRLLERIEHYFINDRITFVFSANLEQLQHTIKNFYGNNFDACRYLDRFFDLRISLTPINTTKYYNSLNLSNNVEIDRVLMRIQQTFNMSLRELCKFYDSVKVSGMKSYFNETEDFMFKYIVTLCLALKITNITLHDEFIEGKNIQPLLDLYMNDLGEYVIYQLRNGMDINKDAGINNYLEIKQDLKDLYDAIFIKNYTYNYTSTVIGAMVFTKDSKKFIQYVESSLSNYSCYDDE